jgi:hypothetical protein
MGLASIWAFVSPKYQNAPEIAAVAMVQTHLAPALGLTV